MWANPFQEPAHSTCEVVPCPLVACMIVVLSDAEWVCLGTGLGIGEITRTIAQAALIYVCLITRHNQCLFAHFPTQLLTPTALLQPSKVVPAPAPAPAPASAPAPAPAVQSFGLIQLPSTTAAPPTATSVSGGGAAQAMMMPPPSMHPGIKKRSCDIDLHDSKCKKRCRICF